MSFLLVGFGKKTYSDLGAPGPEQECVWCWDVVRFRLLMVKTWFTYYFVRVYAYRREYRVECPACGGGLTLRDDEVAAARAGELRLTREGVRAARPNSNRVV